MTGLLTEFSRHRPHDGMPRNWLWISTGMGVEAGWFSFWQGLGNFMLQGGYW